MATGSLVGFLVAVLWLPSAPLSFRGVWHATLGVAVGLSTVVLASAVLQQLPRGSLIVFAQVAALCIVALWCYPLLVRRCGRALLERD